MSFIPNPEKSLKPIRRALAQQLNELNKVKVKLRLRRWFKDSAEKNLLIETQESLQNTISKLDMLVSLLNLEMRKLNIPIS